MKNEYKIQESSRLLKESGFSTNASAAICMWAYAHNEFQPPYFFKNKNPKHRYLGSYVREFCETVESNWNANGCAEKNVEYSGTLDLSESISLDRFKRGFIDVMTLSIIFDNCYDG